MKTNPNYPENEPAFDAHIRRECKRIQAGWKEAERRKRAVVGDQPAVELRPVTMGVLNGTQTGG